MPAAIYDGGEFSVGEFPPPALGPRQIRLRPFANGVCGSDLHAWSETSEFLEANEAAGNMMNSFDPTRPIVFGHEFTGEVLEVGNEVDEGISVGDRLFLAPLVIEPDGQPRVLGYSNIYPGGLSTEVVVESWTGHITLDPDTDPYLAAVLDPIGTGVSGAVRSGATAGSGAIVTGVGPVGLGAVVELAAQGVYPIVASDPSAARREVALAYGATHVVDPRETDPVAVWQDHAPEGSRCHIVEASAAHGLLSHLIKTAPSHTIISVVGAQPVPEPINGMAAVIKNVRLIFCFGQDWGEDRYVGTPRAYEHLKNGRFDPSLMVTGYTGLAGAAKAFEALRPEAGEVEHIKVLVRPDLDVDYLVSPEELEEILR